MDEVLALIFEGGKRLQNTIPATAGNVITNLSPAVLKRWKIQHGILTLVADANAANRYIRLDITDGTDIIQNVCFLDVVVATQTGILNLSRVVQHTTNITLGGAGANVYGSITLNNLILEGADQLRITIEGGLAGDSYEGFVIVMEL